MQNTLWNQLIEARGKPVAARNPVNGVEFHIELQVWPNYAQPVLFEARVVGHPDSRLTGGESDIKAWLETLAEPEKADVPTV